MATIQFNVLPFISPAYKGDHYKSIRYKISQWMTREFKKRPSKLYVNMEQNGGTVTFNDLTPWLVEVITMINEHPRGQLVFDWNQGLKTRKTNSKQYIKPILSLPGINYPQRFEECRHQAIRDMHYLDELDFEDEGVMASILTEMMLIENDEELDEIDRCIDELGIQEEDWIDKFNNLQLEQKEETDPLILEFSSDEEYDTDEYETDDEEEHMPCRKNTKKSIVPAFSKIVYGAESSEEEPGLSSDNITKIFGEGSPSYVGSYI
jgi:hypothetical protein